MMKRVTKSTWDEVVGVNFLTDFRLFTSSVCSRCSAGRMGYLSG